MRQPRSVPQAAQLLRHLRVEQDDPAVLDLVVGKCERTVAERGISNRLMAGLSRMRPLAFVSGLNGYGFWIYGADSLFRRGGAARSTPVWVDCVEKGRKRRVGKIHPKLSDL
jgi:hypothetical protein